MNEDQRLQLLGLGPEGIELGIGQFIAIDACADGRATKVVLLHSFFKLLGREFRELQGHRRVSHEAIRVGRRQHGRELLILKVGEPRGQIAIGGIPIGVNADGFYVDAFLVHQRQTVWPKPGGLGAAGFGCAHRGVFRAACPLSGIRRPPECSRGECPSTDLHALPADLDFSALDWL